MICTLESQECIDVKLQEQTTIIISNYRNVKSLLETRLSCAKENLDLHERWNEKVDAFRKRLCEIEGEVEKIRQVDGGQNMEASDAQLQNYLTEIDCGLLRIQTEMEPVAERSNAEGCEGIRQQITYLNTESVHVKDAILKLK